MNLEKEKDFLYYEYGILKNYNNNKIYELFTLQIFEKLINFYKMFSKFQRIRAFLPSNYSFIHPQFPINIKKITCYFSKINKNPTFLTLLPQIPFKSFSHQNQNNENSQIKAFSSEDKLKITRLDLDPEIPFYQKHKFTISFISLSALSFLFSILFKCSHYNEFH